MAAVLMAGGCSTITSLVDKVTGVSCSKQVELTVIAIDTTSDSIAAAYENKLISYKKKVDYADTMLALMPELEGASANCNPNNQEQDALGKARALKVFNEAQSIKQEVE